MSSGVTPARVLLIEDDEPLATIVAKHLKARGHDARVAGSAEEATEMIRAGYRPTIVLLDINLPGESGWNFLRSGGLDPAGKPPVFVVSATAVPQTRLREFDCAGYLPKPFAVSTLIEIVERHHSEADGDETPPQGGFDAF
ncbi:MAG: response regulator [Candidatus Limnocylindrales bacterium]|jgi:DNA-binding response OmpR family regulator